MPGSARSLLALAVFLMAGAPMFAQAKLQKDLKDIDLGEHWIYNDYEKAVADAKKSGKPILALFRCVPCIAGKDLDDKVSPKDSKVADLTKQFVCVRVVTMRGLDLKLFQFDYDQSIAVMYLNADGTIYGRYGTRAASQKNADDYLTLPSFRVAGERALELHKAYPKNKDALAGKVGKELHYPFAEKIPGLEDKAKGDLTRKNCIHCHEVRERTLRNRWLEGKLKREDIWEYPLPDNVGLKMDIDDGLLVKEVAAGSAAERAGIKAGNRLVELERQPLISIADIQWALHRAPAGVKHEMTVVYLKGDVPTTGYLTLDGHWKETNLSWRSSSWLGLRTGLSTEPLTEAQKKNRDLPADSLALVVKQMFGTNWPSLQKHLKVGDIIIAIDGKSPAMTETQFLVHLRLNHGPDDTVKLTVLRGKEKQEISLPMK